MSQVNNADVRYSPSEKILFWVPDHRLEERSHKTIEFAHKLLEMADAFAEFAGVDPNQICSFVIQRSSHHMLKRAYHVKMEHCPESISRIASTETMLQWTQGLAI